MMDFGFGRFLEMFEDRFGRQATTILLAAIGLAVFGVCVSAIYNNIAIPIYDIAIQIIHSGASLKNITTNSVWAAVISAAVTAGILVIILLYVRYKNKIMIRRLSDVHNSLSAVYAALDQQTKDTAERINAMAHAIQIARSNNPSGNP
jgi:ABC-type Fe3+ transport system permease subunit